MLLFDDEDDEDSEESEELEINGSGHFQKETLDDYTESLGGNTLWNHGNYGNEEYNPGSNGKIPEENTLIGLWGEGDDEYDDIFMGLPEPSVNQCESQSQDMDMSWAG